MVRLNPGDLLVSLDVVSLFTKVVIEPTIKLLEPWVPSPIVKLPEYVYKFMYFIYDGVFYKQKGGIAMGSALPSVVANFLMESFENEMLNMASLKPMLYRSYVDDNFLIWSHGREAIVDFVRLLNSR